ncbi:MAG: hypothetical protein QNJ90_13695 [Planctomycetota bacterium]|nr:hypothetical protein [Planctomycetota bacterium]
MSAGEPRDPDQDRRSKSDRRQTQRRQRKEPVEVDRRTGKDRRQGPRRKRSMNQYDMSEDVLEFINAINRFKSSTGRSFPTWSEVLEILRGLGYEKQS